MKKINGIFSKLWNALREKKVPIKPCQTDLMNYDGFVLCCPVWGGKTPPAINQYLSEIKNVKGQKIRCFRHFWREQIPKSNNSNA